MYAHDNIVPNEDSNLSKKEQVAHMFNAIAGKYDFFNRFLSAGIDVKWRKQALKKITYKPIHHMLDMATGTADVALMAHKLLAPERITGMDISSEMLAVAQQKINKKNAENTIHLQLGDSEAINYPNHTFDAVTVAFGVRNFQNLEQGIAEIYRVLQPGKMLVVLEFSKPKNSISSKFYQLYNSIVAPSMVSMLSKHKKAYQYLNSSINAFPEREHFVAILEKQGFTQCTYQELSLGICCIYTAIK